MHDLILKGTYTTLPVGKMLCLGKNYERHAREMGSAAPEFPVVFMKPPTALVQSGGVVMRPSYSQELHHEVELVVVIGNGGSMIPEERAMEHVLGYAVGLDMTLRDLQNRAKKQGEPWTLAKAFDTSAPVSQVVEQEAIDDPHHLELRLTVNGELRQHGSTSDMLMSIPATIAFLSRFFTLERGDLIFTGTPEGVGPVVPGDRLVAELVGQTTLEVTVGERG